MDIEKLLELRVRRSPLLGGEPVDVGPSGDEVVQNFVEIVLFRVAAFGDDQKEFFWAR